MIASCAVIRSRRKFASSRAAASSASVRVNSSLAEFSFSWSTSSEAARLVSSRSSSKTSCRETRHVSRFASCVSSPCLAPRLASCPTPLLNGVCASCPASRAMSRVSLALRNTYHSLPSLPPARVPRRRRFLTASSDMPRRSAASPTVARSTRYTPPPGQGHRRQSVSSTSVMVYA